MFTNANLGILTNSSARSYIFKAANSNNVVRNQKICDENPKKY